MLVIVSGFFNGNNYTALSRQCQRAAVFSQNPPMDTGNGFFGTN